MLQMMQYAENQTWRQTKHNEIPGLKPRYLSNMLHGSGVYTNPNEIWSHTCTLSHSKICPVPPVPCKRKVQVFVRSKICPVPPVLCKRKVQVFVCAKICSDPCRRCLSHVDILQRTAKKYTKILTARVLPLFCSLNLLFDDALVAVAVVVC